MTDTTIGLRSEILPHTRFTPPRQASPRFGFQERHENTKARLQLASVLFPTDSNIFLLASLIFDFYAYYLCIAHRIVAVLILH